MASSARSSSWRCSESDAPRARVTTYRAHYPPQESSGCWRTAPKKPARCAWGHSSWNAPAKDRVLRHGPEAHDAIDGEADLSGLEHHGRAAPGTSRPDRRPRRSCPDAPASSIGERRDAVDTGYVSGADGQRHPDQSTLEVGGEELDV